MTLKFQLLMILKTSYIYIYTIYLSTGFYIVYGISYYCGIDNISITRAHSFCYEDGLYWSKTIQWLNTLVV